MKLQKYFRTIQQQDKPFKFIISKLLLRLKISQYFSFKHQHHYLKFYPSYLSRILWVDPQHGHSGTEVENFVWKYLKNNDTFVDIGANIGTVTLEASKKIGDKGKIFMNRLLSSHLNITEHYLLELGGALGAHAGPGALAVGLQKVDN